MGKNILPVAGTDLEKAPQGSWEPPFSFLDILFKVDFFLGTDSNILLQNSLNFLMLQVFKFRCFKGFPKLGIIILYFPLEN